MRHQCWLDTCFCDMTATQERAPTEAEFISFFSVAFTLLLAASCVSSVVECESGSPFQTVFVASFSDQTEIETYVASMKIAFMKSVSSLYLNIQQMNATLNFECSSRWM
jgi:hypothetical protein